MPITIPMVQVKKCLTHYFNEKERSELSENMSQAFVKKSQLEGRLKTVQAQIKSQIAEQHEIVNQCAIKLSAGYEMRDIPCRMVRNYEEGVIQYFRTDNWTIAEQRRMEEEDRQKLLGEPNYDDTVSIQDVLGAVNVDVTVEQIEEWTMAQRIQAYEWASLYLLPESCDLVLPVKPDFLPEAIVPIPEVTEVVSENGNASDSLEGIDDI